MNKVNNRKVLRRFAFRGLKADRKMNFMVILSIVLLSLLEAGINRFPQISSYYITLIWGAVLLLVMVLNYFAEHPITRKAGA